MSLLDGDRPIYIKKIPPPPPAHGGAWKEAYADFVTAMMAFFLLLWLLNATTVDQKLGISNYFEPTGAIKGSSGSGGVFGGTSMTDPGVDPKPGKTMEKLVGTESEIENELENQTKQVKKHDKVKSATPAEVEREQQELEKVERAMKQALFDLPQLAALKNSMMVEVTDQGLLIQVVDQKGSALFVGGSSKLTPLAQKLLKLVASMVKRLPNKIEISGHTDAAAYNGPRGRTNWELSLERANAARRELLRNGIPAARFDSVVGRADKVPLLKDNPTSPRNRRISVVMLREKKELKKDDKPRPPRIF